MKPAHALALVLLGLTAALLPAVAQEPKEGEAPHPPYTQEQIQKWQDLTQAAQNAYQEKNWAKAAELHEEAMKVVEKGQPAASSAYNVACCHARAGKTDAALTWLGRSIELGFCDATHIEQDEDLVSLRETEGYRRLHDGLLWNDEVAVHVPEGVAPDAALPVLIALHPDHMSETRLVEFLRPLADQRKILLVAPRAPFHVGVDQYDWTRESSDDAPAVKKVGLALEAAAKAHATDPDRIVLLGIRRGGYLAYLLGLSQADRYRRIVVVNGYFNKWYFPDFFEKAKPLNRGIYVLHSTKMPQLDNARDAKTLLLKAGFPVESLEYDTESLGDPLKIDLLGKALTW